MDAKESVLSDRRTRIDVEVEALRQFIKNGGSEAVDISSKGKKLSESISELCAILANLAIRNISQRSSIS